MKYILVLVALAAIAVGCARGVSDPIAPVAGDEAETAISRFTGGEWDGPYRLWGEWTFYIDETHTKIDVVPQRNGRFHLNTLKFLEEYCADCLEITGIQNNGDGTIDVMVQITHPFPGMPEFTGFDVKGIIMFDGSHEFDKIFYFWPLAPQKYRVSWRLKGDPELMNADGYTYRWSPWYDSGSSMPIFNYWPGKYSSGTPTANINGYLNFYSNEERHMFECNTKVTRTYRIWLPPGPIAAGYSVEACWEPPLVTPVTNPAEDFPVTANQPEPYHFNIVVNNGEPITDATCCNYESPYTVDELRVEMNLWHLSEPFELYQDKFMAGMCANELDDGTLGMQSIHWDDHCDGPPDWWCLHGTLYVYLLPEGTIKCFGVETHYKSGGPAPQYPAFTVFEMVIDKS